MVSGQQKTKVACGFSQSRMLVSLTDSFTSTFILYLCMLYVSMYNTYVSMLHHSCWSSTVYTWIIHDVCGMTFCLFFHVVRDTAKLTTDFNSNPLKTFEDYREEKQFTNTFNCSEYGAAGDYTFLQTENHVSGKTSIFSQIM